MPRWVDLDNPKIINSGRDKFGNVLYAIPPDTSCADVRPVVHSKWEQVEVLYVTENPNNMPEAIASMFCPNCNRWHNEVYIYGNPIENVNFCPYCGADNREAEK